MYTVKLIAKDSWDGTLVAVENFEFETWDDLGKFLRLFSKIPGIQEQLQGCYDVDKG